MAAGFFDFFRATWGWWSSSGETDAPSSTQEFIIHDISAFTVDDRSEFIVNDVSAFTIGEN